MIASTYAFVELKSFGDLVITAASLRLLPPIDLARCRLVIGPYLNELAAALIPPCTVETLAISDENVPALFDLKKRGIAAGLTSALVLRDALAKAAPGSTLVLPRLARRERFITAGRNRVALPAADNVYTAYDCFMRDTFTFLGSRRVSANIATPSRRIAVCPFSRVPAKNVPAGLVAQMVAVCANAGFQAEALLLQGERPEAPISGLEVRTIPRRFDALADALAEYAGVISADSLPAHLAEYRGTPTFVASPVANSYWLPSRAFKGQHWGLFAQGPELTARLQRFLDTAQS